VPDNFERYKSKELNEIKLNKFKKKKKKTEIKGSSEIVPQLYYRIAYRRKIS